VTSYPAVAWRGWRLDRSEAATDQLSFFLSPSGFRATVTAGKFFHAPGGIHKLLFAGEKWMTSSTNTDLDIATSRAGVVHRAARANHICLVIFWMDAGFHLERERRI
jgi:hypothetical protein